MLEATFEPRTLTQGTAIEAAKIEVNNDTAFCEAVEMMRECARARKAIEARFERAKSLAKSAHSGICAHEKSELQPYVDAYETLALAGGAYVEAQQKTDAGIPVLGGVAVLTKWKFRVIDEKKVPKKFWSIDETKLRKHVEQYKQHSAIAGVELHTETKISVQVKEVAV